MISKIAEVRAKVEAGKSKLERSDEYETKI